VPRKLDASISGTFPPPSHADTAERWRMMTEVVWRRGLGRVEVGGGEGDQNRQRPNAIGRYSEAGHPATGAGTTEVATEAFKPLSRIQNRLLEPCPEHELEICFQHTVLCQTGLPYRNPKGLRFWQRQQGFAALEIEAGRAFDPEKNDWVNVPLPWGPKPRLVLAHLNAEALRLDSPKIVIDDSLSAFVKRIRGFDGGREIRMFEQQLRCLSTATIGLAMDHAGHTHQINTHLVTGFVDLWFRKDDRQRVLWNPRVRLSQEYFESLKHHAVPLNEADLAALAHTAMGSMYTPGWLSACTASIPKSRLSSRGRLLRSNSAPYYHRMDNFKRFFRKTLTQVQPRYQTARLELDDRGMTARTARRPSANGSSPLNKLARQPRIQASVSFRVTVTW
jgi:Plasmid encoded RepA protein